MKERWILAGLLLLAALNGILYIYLVSPWQHYDEPNHFEYAWLVAHQTGSKDSPEVGLSRHLMRSMLRYHFYRGQSIKPVLPPHGQPISIGGFSQLEEPPGYYLLASFPMRFINPGYIESQLYAGRWVSWVMFLITILVAWGVMHDLTNPGNPLRWMVPAFLALLPGFVDIMTALNNDVGAILFFSLSLWGTVRLVRRGFSLQDLALSIIPALLAFYIKKTALLAVPVSLLGLWFCILKNRRKLAWAGLASGILLVFAVTLEFGDPAYWYRSTAQASAIRVQASSSIPGSYAFQIDTRAGTTPYWMYPLFQPLPMETGKALLGKTVTFGAWMWASQPVEMPAPAVNTSSQSFGKNFTLTEKPIFVSYQAVIPEKDPRIWLSILPLYGSEIQPMGVTLYYDNLVLANGAYPLDVLPEFSDQDGISGNWGGKPFTNLLRNASAEANGLRFRPWADALGARVLADNTRPSLILTSVLDLKTTAWFFWISAVRILRTFWGQFGWGNVPLLGNHPYQYLGWLTLVLVIAASLAVARRWRSDLTAPALLGIALLGVLGATMVRGVMYLGEPHLYLPVARYMYPAIIPAAFILCAGWTEIWGWLSSLAVWIIQNSAAAGLAEIFRSTTFWNLVAGFTFTGVMVGMQILSVLSILAFYHRT